MKTGDLIKFKGSWGSSIPAGERRFGIVMKVWWNGRTKKQQSCEVLWDNGDYGINHSVSLMEVINEDR